MTAEIISIGDELLIGQVINTNASWLSEQFNMAGIKIFQVTTISDHREHILETLKQAHRRTDIILMTGGLGPTKDDITKQTLCEYFETSLRFDEEAFNNIKRLFGTWNRNISELNRRQAEIPASCTPIQNQQGTAPGMWFEKEGKIYISLPGVPFEMKAMVQGFILPELSKKFHLPAIRHKTVLTYGIAESALASKIAAWEDELPKIVKLAYLPQPGMVRLRLSAYGDSGEILDKIIDDQLGKLIKIIPDEIVGYDNELLEQITGKLLRSKGKTLSTAESCTGGYIAHLITSVAGSSDYFKGSVVAYANEIKENLLGVNHQSLLQFGAVSEEVVKQMAESVKRKFVTDYSIAVSGVAGPGGGTPEKPVGTTWIAVTTPGKTIARHFMMGNDRERNIRKTALVAINMLRKEIIADL
jgi:nicotinamide-nucleotide amidase